LIASARPATGTRGTAAPAVLRLAGVSKVYPGEPPVAALRDVNLQVSARELLAIVGRSGSGKSTLLHVMGTLERPTTGTVQLSGEDVSRMGDAKLSALRARRIGFVFQQFHLLPESSALENVATGLLYSGAGRKAALERAANVLDLVGLSHRLAHRPAKLSGGEQQRVAIARALVGDPDIVLADEPTGNLDSAAGGEILSLLRTLNAGGSAIAVITHDQAIAASLPRIVEISDGVIVRDSGREEGA